MRTLRGFKDFVMRGNVVDLSVGVVIGAAFTGLVTTFTNSFIKPLLQLFGASGDPKYAGTWDVGGQKFGWAAFLNALITFAMTAAVLYFFVVVPMNRLAERRNKGDEPPPQAPSEEIKLLTEIRDALRAAAPADHPGGPPQVPAQALSPQGSPEAQ